MGDAPWKWTREHLESVFRTLFPGEDPGTPQARKKARVLRAATELFIQHGYKKTSVDEIARRAEVAKGTVYLYFKSKSDLLMHAIALEKQILLTKLEPILDGKIPEEERLHFYVRFMLTVARDLPLVARLMSGDNEVMVALDDWSPELLEQGRAFSEEWLMAMIEDAAPYELDDEERRERANVLLTLRWFVVMLLDERIRGGRTLDQLADTMADVLVYGLVNRPPEDGDLDFDDDDLDDEAAD